MTLDQLPRYACRNCRRPLHWVDGVGWLHGEVLRYAGDPITCNVAVPLCECVPCGDHNHTLVGPDPCSPGSR